MKNTSDYCCLYCAENHPSQNCPTKKKKKMFSDFKCSNCLKSSIHSVKSKAHSHTTTSKDCPILQSEIKSLVNKTMGYNSKNLLPPHVVIT